MLDAKKRLDIVMTAAMDITSELPPEELMHFINAQECIKRLIKDECVTLDRRVTDYASVLLELEISDLEKHLSELTRPELPVLPTDESVRIHRHLIFPLHQDGSYDNDGGWTRFTIIRHPFGRVRTLTEQQRDIAKDIVLRAAEEDEEGYGAAHAGDSFKSSPYVAWGYNHAVVSVSGGLDI